ncbi:MAG: hypothetical protein J0H67_01880 [Rhodospirillales bacterium]|nr:hypothetical protein [Rhodospirillales bacterium]
MKALFARLLAWLEDGAAPLDRIDMNVVPFMEPDLAFFALTMEAEAARRAAAAAQEAPPRAWPQEG